MRKRTAYISPRSALPSTATDGVCHIRYGHQCRPRVLHVRCPRCHHCACADKVSEMFLNDTLIGDISPSWSIPDDWQITCYSCGYRRHHLHYDDLPPLYYQDGITLLWAWNRDHLHAQIAELNGTLTKSNPYHYLMSYMPTSWTQRKDRTIQHLQWLDMAVNDYS